MYALPLQLMLYGSLAACPGMIEATTASLFVQVNHESIIVLVEDPGPRRGSGGGMETGKTGTGKETDAGRGTPGKKSPFGADQPTTGDFSPNPSDATRSQPKPTDKTVGSDQPAGIGEKGSGQTRSTQERSGGQQPSASESMSPSASKHGEGKTEKAMKDLQSQKPKNK